MTKEDALFFLGRFRTKEINEKLYDALGVAIEALNAQTKQPDVPDTNVGDTISRYAAIDAVSKGCQELRGVFGRCEENILALPSAQPERGKGKWINYDKKHRLATCSKCNKITMFELWETKVKFYDYCPNCGADMRDDFSQHMNPPED